jgi:hypothetical protein
MMDLNGTETARGSNIRNPAAQVNRFNCGLLQFAWIATSAASYSVLRKTLPQSDKTHTL